MRGLKVGERLDLPTWVHAAPGRTFAGRLVALRRSAAATRREQRRLQQKASKQQRPISQQRLKLARYLLVWTTLAAEEYPASDITEFYRWRWQVEPGFKRMKSILDLGHLPKTDPPSARAWLHGKLLISLLVERMIQAANTFSPWGY